MAKQIEKLRKAINDYLSARTEGEYTDLSEAQIESITAGVNQQVAIWGDPHVEEKDRT